MNIRSQQGLSMIEVLVALFILAIGIMGQMAMQMTSLASSQSSYYRSQAAAIANDFADRIRLNPDGAADPDPGAPYNYSNAVINEETNHTEPDCHSAGCEYRDQVLMDIYEIQQSLKARIPSGALSLEDLGAVYRITISWSAEDRAGLVNSDEINQLVMDFGI